MASLQQFLVDQGHKNFMKACQLNDAESANDPENEPYKSKYKARVIWAELKETVQRCFEAEGEKAEEWLFLLAVLELKIGVNYVDTEEVATGEQYLNRAAERLNPYRLNKRGCSTLQIIMNELGIMWTGRRNDNKALAFLKEAETLYREFKHEVGSAPYMPNELFTVQNDDEEQESDMIKTRSDHFEDTYTHTLYYLAQVYKKLGEADTAAAYCHNTLQRQLDTMKYDPYEWALNCATLSQFYIQQGDFRLARHCLASASFIYSELGDIGPSKVPPPGADESQADVEKRERLPRGRADLARCWAKYCLSLLEASQAKLYNETELFHVDHNTDKKSPDADRDENDKLDDAKKAASQRHDEEKPGENKNAEKNKLLFNLEVTSHEDQITFELVKTFDQARVVFLLAQKYLNLAKDFYVTDGYCSDHVEIVQDISKLYKHLAFFEFNMDRQCKMHKRRVDVLSDILKQLNSQFYLLLCRQLMYELAETYSAMLDIKLAILEDEGTTPSAHAVKKINLLADQSIKQYLAYIDSLKDANKMLPERFSDDDERPALVAHFCIGRLYSKFIHADVGKRLSYMNLSMQYYKFLVDYGKKNPESIPRMKSEFEICEEMVTLMPHKMERLRSQCEF